MYICRYIHIHTYIHNTIARLGPPQGCARRGVRVVAMFRNSTEHGLKHLVTIMSIITISSSITTIVITITIIIYYCYYYNYYYYYYYYYYCYYSNTLLGGADTS